MTETIDLVIITGMSGAGKTVAVQSFEDMGYYCIDNMPPKLLPHFIQLIQEGNHWKQVAVVIDLRSRDFFQDIYQSLEALRAKPALNVRVLFLDATDEELITRYKETRRSHPLAKKGRVLDGIQLEREFLEPIRKNATEVVDTSKSTPRQLRMKLRKKFAEKEKDYFHVELISFGFKNGLPIDSDLVMDVRFLPNPFYIPELREQRGTDAPVYDFVMEQEETRAFLEMWMELILFTLPKYQREGKSSLTISIGCTGGHHRSVAIVEWMAKQIQEANFRVNITHRDIDIVKETKVNS